MKRKYAAIVLGLTMTLTTANISAVNIMAATASTAEERNKQNQRIQTAASQKKENKSDSDNQEDGNEKQSEGEGPLTERIRMAEPPEKPEGQEPNGGQGAPGEQSNGRCKAMRR